MVRRDRQPIAVDAQTLLDTLTAARDDTALRSVCNKVEHYLQPVVARSDRGQASSAAGRPYSLFLAQLLKQSLARLTDDVLPAVRESLFQLATLGLEGMAAIRAALKGRPHEVEVLRYTLVRKLVLLACFSKASEQSWLIYCALCYQCWQANSERLFCNMEPAKLQPIPFPDRSEDSEVATLVAGTVLNMLLSFSEQTVSDKQIPKLVHVSANLETITAWLSLLPKTDGQKHLDTLFRYLLKVLEKLSKLLPVTAQMDLISSALQLTVSEPSQGTTLALNLLQPMVSSCQSSEFAEQLMSVVCDFQQRHADITTLQLLHIITTTVMIQQQQQQQPEQGHHCSDVVHDNAWVAQLDEANTQTALLVRQLKAQSTCRAACARHTSTTAVAATHSLPELTQAVISAISGLRKVLQANATGKAAADWLITRHRSSVTALCACLEALPLLVHGALELPQNLYNVEDHSKSADRYSYSALSGLVCAAQMRTALALHEVEDTSPYKADAFHHFWPSAVSRDVSQVSVLSLKATEARWASSVLYSCAVQLQQCGAAALATELLIAACDGAALSIAQEACLEPEQQHHKGEGSQAHIQSFAKKVSTLADFMHQQGRSGAALQRIGTAVALLSQSPGTPTAVLQWLIQSFVNIRAACQDTEPMTTQPVAAAKRSRAGKGSSRSSRQKSVLGSMQTDAAGSLPLSATVAMYVQQMQPGVEVGALGKVITMELKALRQASYAKPQAAALFQQLRQLWDSDEHPVLHAQALLLQACLAGMLAPAESPLQLAQQALKLLQDQGPEATETRAVASAMCALLVAEQGRRHTACNASPPTHGEQHQDQSASSSKLAHVKRRSSNNANHPDSSNSDVIWRQALTYTQQAIHVLAQCCSEEEAGHAGSVLQGAASATGLVTELLFLMGLHGNVELQSSAADLLSTSSEKDAGSHNNIETLCNIPTIPLLAWSLEPVVVSAVASGTLPGHSLAHANKTARGQLAHGVSAGDTLQQMAHDLAAANKGTACVMWNRALLHQLAAQAFMFKGQTVACLYHASEALRLGNTLFVSLCAQSAGAEHHADQQSSPDEPPRDSKMSESSTSKLNTVADVDLAETESQVQTECSSLPKITQSNTLLQGQGVSSSLPHVDGMDGIGYWQVAWLYLTSLLKLGEVYEMAGSHEDAMHAFKEGQELARRCHAIKLYAVFSLRVAEVLSKRHDWGLCSAELVTCTSTLDTASGPTDEVDILISASVLRLKGIHAQQAGSCQQQLTYCEEALSEVSKAVKSQKAGLQDLIQHLAYALQLDMAECKGLMGNTTGAQNALADFRDSSALEACPAGKLCPAFLFSNGLQSCDAQHARALLLQARLAGPKSQSRLRPDKVSIAGSYATTMQQRQMSHASASTSAPKQEHLVRSRGRGAKTSRKGKQPQTQAVPEATRDRNELSPQTELHKQLHLLLQAYTLSKGMPLLHRQVASELSRCCAALGLVQASVLFQHASLGASVTLQYSGILKSKLLALQRRQQCKSATPAAEQVSSALEQAAEALESGVLCEGLPGLLQDLESDPVSALQALEEQSTSCLQALTAHGPKSALVCSVALMPSMSHTSQHPAQPPKTATYHIAVTRCNHGSAPVLMHLPISCDMLFAVAEDVDESMTAPQGSAAVPDSLATGSTQSDLQPRLPPEALREFGGILNDSAASMKADVPLMTNADKSAWWKQRLALDRRMANLLKHLDTAWLGPWRVLVFGLPSDDIAYQGISAAAAEMAQELFGDIHKADVDAQSRLESVTSLLEALLIGLPSLTQTELQSACVDVLQMADTTDYTVAGSTLAHKLRSMYRNACAHLQPQGSSLAQPTADSVLGDATNLVTPPARLSSRSRTAATAVKTYQGKLSTRARAASNVHHTTVRQHRPSRFATMQAATSAAPARHSRTTAKAQTSSAETDVHDAQEPALVSQLQARFDALALAEMQQGNGSQAAELDADPDARTCPVLQHEPTLLILDGQLQAMPWESLPSFKHLRIYRSPSLACAAAVAARQTHGSECQDSAADARHKECLAVDLASTVYMVNPGGDLTSTQGTFQTLFSQQETWQGTFGEPIPPGPLAEALQEQEMFLYFGHGSGDQYLSARTLRRLPHCASTLLMGCSSGSLSQSGCYEPSGPVLAYLMAGCPVAIANLWDVTDRDIDRFSEAVLMHWLHESKSSCRDNQTVAHPLCVSTAVSDSRQTCKLVSLIGAAPVCYGIPVSVKSRANVL